MASIPHISINPSTNKIYVPYSRSNTVSVIDGNTNNVTQVKVGLFPSQIAVNDKTDLVYIPTFRRLIGSVDVIDDHTVGYSNENIIDTILFEHKAPSAIAVNENRNKIYVAYGSSNIVSVIDGDSKNVTQVKVAGSQPWAIAVNPNTNKIYVIDIFSNIVSVIDGDSNNVVAGIIFNISPSDSGHIKCNNRESSSKQYIDFGTQCVAEPNSYCSVSI